MTITHTPSTTAITLGSVDTNHTCIFADVHADVPLCQRRRMAELGLRKGCIFQVVQKTSGGGVVIKCGATRYAVDRKTANQISVTLDASHG